MAKAFRLKTLQPTEHQVQTAILRYLAVSPRVAWAERMNTGAIKIPAANGRDRFLRFAVRATEAQTAFLALVATHGGVAVLARSLDDLTPFLEMPA